MADGVAITAGSGTTILTDDTGAPGHAQVMKLAISTDGSGTLIPADAGNGLDVDVTRVTGTVTIAGAVTNAGTFVVQENGAALTSLQLIDDVVVADDAAFTPATTKVLMAGFTFDDVAPDSVNEGDGGAARMSANRVIYVTLRDAAGNERGLNVDANGAVAATVTNATATNLKAEVTGATAGSGTATGAIRVELPTNGTGVVGLNAGTNAIGKLAANSGVDIGDVDVTTVGTITPGTAASSLGKAEDAVHADGDVGVMALGVRKNTAASTSGADGDYQPFITNTTGHLWVDASGQTLTVGNVATIGTSVVPGTSATHLGKAEDAVHTSGDTGVAAWGVALADANALTLQASATGDYSILSQDARGVLQVVSRPQATRISTTSAGLTTAATAYTIGDQAGTILTISGAAKVSGGTGVIQSITLLDEGDVGVSYRLHFYNQTVTLAADNAAFAVSDADQRNYVGTILMPDLQDVGANRVATLTNAGLGYLCSGSTSLFCAIETRTANAVYAAVGDLKLILHVYQD